MSKAKYCLLCGGVMCSCSTCNRMDIPPEIRLACQVCRFEIQPHIRSDEALYVARQFLLAKEQMDDNNKGHQAIPC